MTSKEAYEKKLEAKIEEWNAELDKLRAQAKGRKADAQADLDKHLSDLESKRDAARAKLEELQDASADAWEDLKDGAERSWKEFESAFASASKHFL